MAGDPEIDPDELRVTFVRSSGPGGQNVNKVSTRAVVCFSVPDSLSLTDRQRRLITRNLAGRISRSGRIRVSCQRHRTQRANRQEAIERLLSLLAEACTPPKERRKTRVPARAKARRLAEKRHRARIKEMRRRGASQDN
jgi:ribosome-associated protein